MSSPPSLSLFQDLIIEKTKDQLLAKATSSSNIDDSNSSTSVSCKDISYLAKDKESVDDDISCKVCSGACNVFLHKLCAELPNKVRNTLHRKHRLELFPMRSCSRRRCGCDLCGENIHDLVKYSCLICQFDLHVKCSLQTTFDEPQGHRDHSFVNIKPTIFICDACGLKGDVESLSRICTGCQIQVHITCASSFPYTVKQRGHRHELSLVYSFQIDFDFSNKSCRICYKKMNSVFCLYQCTDCALYFAHAGCAASNVVAIDRRFEDYDSDDEPRSVNHFSHPGHVLTVTNDETVNVHAVCDGCVRPVSFPLYTCANVGCVFFIHEKCFELPKVIQHPLHPAHPLELKSSKNFSSEFLFRCYGCDSWCNGFAYHCSSCDFFLDVGCSLLSGTLDHEAHKCTLKLVDHMETRDKKISSSKTVVESSTNKCSGCGLNSSCKFVCGTGCNFELGLRCASLPKEIRHECPKQDYNVSPLKLFYGAINSGTGEAYCNICEESIGENDWFYRCEDCNHSSHPICILKEPFKYGRTNKIEAHPRHPVIFVRRTAEDQICGWCGKTILKYDGVYLCVKCDVYFHFPYCDS